MLTFVSGGARSGKSSWAEEFVKQVHSQKRPLVYLATAERSDQEMTERISRHQSERGSAWKTIECPVKVTEALTSLAPGDTVLLDCLTIWVSHMMYKEKACLSIILKKIEEWFILTKEMQLSLTVVSNDVNEGMPSENDTVGKYIYILESVHQVIAEKADRVIQVVAGLPLHWKGENA